MINSSYLYLYQIKQYFKFVSKYFYNNKISKNCLVIIIKTQMTESVKVMVRCRPMSQKQIQKDCKNIVLVNQQTHQIGLKKITNLNTTLKYFAYDYVFAQDSTQQQVYQQSSFSLVQNVLNGYNGTIFAYGQTGCGKTHTMLGVTTTLSTRKAQMITQTKQNLPVTVTSLRLEQQTMGIIPRAFHQIMTVTNSNPSKNHLIQCTFIQIYNEEIHDLLGKDIKTKLTLQQTPEGLTMRDLSIHIAKNISDMEKYMEIGYKNRVIRQTSMNKQSSRSHCIFTIRIEESQYDSNGVQKFRVGKLNLVDLAGSERQSKTNLKDQGIKQAAKINLSLSALGNVISALVDGKKQHIPYRDSKLTRILNDSLGGNTKTVMIATISPADYNYEETLSTLRYSSRAKFIQNKPIVNEDPKDALLRKYEEQIRRLKLILEGKLPYIEGNKTFYINKEQKQQNIFNKFPELKNQQNEAILNEITQIKNSIDKLNNEYLAQIDGEQINYAQKQASFEKPNQQEAQVTSLKNQLKFLEQIVKKQINTSPQVAEQLQKMNQLKEKLKQQSLRQEKYKQSQKKREQQLLNIEKNYQNLNEQVDSIKQKFQQLRIKYVQKTEQLKDSRQAHEKQKEDILDALRIQQAQNIKLMEILNVIVPAEQLEHLFTKCQWHDHSKQWVVPKFQYSQKYGIILPSNHQKSQLKQKILLKSENKIPSNRPLNTKSDNGFQNELQNLQKFNKANKLNNLIVQQSQVNKFNKRISKSQYKIIPERGGSYRQSLKDVNFNKSTEKIKKFKNSYYSDSNATYQTNKKEEQKKQIDRNKFSLKSFPKIKAQNLPQKPVRVSLDLEQIKREIMNQMRSKSKMGSGFSRKN